jgi:heptose I phosphotransferase
MTTFLSEELQKISGTAEPLDWLFLLADKAKSIDVFREKEGRKTFRFKSGNRYFFAKIHRGVGWKEILKNLFKLRWPVLGAENEYRALLALNAVGIETMTVEGFGQSGCNPAKRSSFIVTEELYNTISLEDYCAGWSFQKPSYSEKCALLEKLARVSRTMHGAGINHRDYYLCHFHLDVSSLATVEPPVCYLIDLHRAQIRSRTSRRWYIKDLAGLYYSAMDAGLRRRDLLRFISIYSGVPASTALKQDGGFWQQVEKRANKLYRRDHGRAAPVID